jgi:hypothetical protein
MPGDSNSEEMREMQEAIQNLKRPKQIHEEEQKRFEQQQKIREIERKLLDLQKNQQEPKLSDLLTVLREIFVNYPQPFKLVDLFDIIKSCIKENMNIDYVLHRFVTHKEYYVYILVDDSDKFHGMFQNELVAKHYCEQLRKVGQEISIKKYIIQDNNSPTEMQHWTIDFRYGIATKTYKMWTFYPDLYTLMPTHMKNVSIGDRIQTNHVESCLAIVPSKDEKILTDLVLETRRMLERNKLVLVPRVDGSAYNVELDNV